MIRAILNYFKNRNNPDLEKQDYEIEVNLSVTGLVVFIVIVYLICKFI